MDDEGAPGMVGKKEGLQLLSFLFAEMPMFLG